MTTPQAKPDGGPTTERMKRKGHIQKTLLVFYFAKKKSKNSDMPFHGLGAC